MEKFANLLFSSGSIIVASTVLFKSFTYTVDGGQRALIFDRFRGLKETISGEGMHFFIPFIQVKDMYHKRIQLFLRLDFNQKQLLLILEPRIFRQLILQSECCTNP